MILTGLVAVVLAVLAAVAVVNRAPTGGGPLEPMPGPDPGMGSVYALAVEAGTGTVYAGTRFGLFRITEIGQASRVANRRQETHGLAVLGPGHLLASGHPDPRESLPSKLGLIDSTDGGRTWERRGRVGGLSQAIVASGYSRLLVATDTGIYVSDDHGWTFTLYYREN